MKDIHWASQAARRSTPFALALLLLAAPPFAPPATPSEDGPARLYYLPNLDDSPHLLGFAKLEHDCESDFFALFLRPDTHAPHLDNHRADLEIEVGDLVYRFDSRVVAHPKPGKEGPPVLAFFGHAIDPKFFPLAEQTSEITIRITGPKPFLEVLQDPDNRFSTEGLVEKRLAANRKCLSTVPKTSR